MHKAGARWAGCSDGDTPAPSTSSVLTLHNSNTRGRDAFLGGGAVPLWSSGTGGTCDSFSLNINILGKTSCTASCLLLQLRLCQSSVQLLGTTILGPFCGLGLCQTQARSLFYTPVGSQQLSKARIMIPILQRKIPSFWAVKSLVQHLKSKKSYSHYGLQKRESRA
jgi:hypothetical protein